MSIPQITSLLEFCLTHTYFLFQGKYYEQVQGAAMGSPISPLIANIFMEEFEVQALQSFPSPPSLWLRFVDDTFVIGKADTQSGSPPTHKQPGSPHPIYSGAHHTRITTLLGHPSYHTTRQYTQHFSLQETHTYRSIPSLGQQPPHHSQAKCIQHPSTQGQNSFFHPTQLGKGTLTHQNSSPLLPVPPWALNQ